MKNLVILFGFILATSALSDYDLWLKFKQDHDKVYKSTKEEMLRFNTFKANLRKIEEHNAKYEKGESTYFLGINHFSDWTQDEVIEMFARSKSSRPEKVEGKLYERTNISVPDSFDWRTKGVVTPVKKQKCDGDSYAHGTTGVLEGQYALTHGQLIPLSQQNLIDCTVYYDNFGCAGGYYYSSYKYVRDNGIESEADYPYEGVNGTCRYNWTKVAASVHDAFYLPMNDENALKEAVGSVGPIGVYIQADYMVTYAGGVYTDTRCSNRSEDLNHAVLVVGYGNEGQDYWLIKNSWGTDWGEQGYIKLARNANNLCGVAYDGGYATVW